MREEEKFSEGAEKVENLAEEKREKARRAEEEKAQARLDAALKKEEEKKRKEEMKREKKEEKARKIAEDRAQKERRKEHAAEDKRRRREDKDRKQHAPGFGGWLTAVITLGVTVLALGAVVTVGYFDLTEAKSGLYNGYQSAVWELSELTENLNANLSKVRVATGNYEMQKILTDILVESELAENCLQSFPVDGHGTENLTAYINRMADYSRKLLNRLAMGGEITEEDEQVLEYMYFTTQKINIAARELSGGMKGKNLDELLSGKEFRDKFDELEHNTIETPKMIYDGPFAATSNAKGLKAVAGEKEVTEKDAEKIVKDLFIDYKIKDIKAEGKTEHKDMCAYNFTFTTEEGAYYYAQLTERGGKLMMFDGYEKKKQDNFGQEECIRKAEEFLHKAGYDGMEAVWANEGEEFCDINFAYEQDGVICYPDLIKVKVCKECGMVTGMEAHAYLTNHTERDLGTPSVSEKKIERAAERKMELRGVRLAVIPVEEKETLAYEINGFHDGNEYYAYLDAKTGRMVELFTVVGSGAGRALM